MKIRTFVVTLEVEVFDAREVIKAARVNAKAQGIKGAIKNTSDAVQWLLDPGVSPPGTQIEHSSIEESRL